MMINKKKIAYKAVAYATIGFAFVASSVLAGSLTNHNQTTNLSPQLKNTSVKQKVTNEVSNGSNITENNLDFTIRSNPTNGFNGLTTPDGKYTFVLITKNVANTPETVGGANSGIACIENNTGDVISTRYLPGNGLWNLNYTTNIVFGQTSDGKIDPSTIFVLCGISNLAAAINTAYEKYDTNYEEHVTDSQAHYYSKVVNFQTNINAAPTIKIFKLTVNDNGFIDQNTTAFYNFAYPSDGTNGHAGFNAKGVPYNMYATPSYTDSKDLSIPFSMPDDLNTSMYFASGINFDGIKRTDLGDIGSIQPSSFQPIKDTTIGAFGSFLTYLTYGQNFAYHLGTNGNYQNKDEFIMTSSFVNVDQNIGGLYSALVNNDDATDTVADGLNSFVTTQSKWPVPFGYQWLLADIAAHNKSIEWSSGGVPQPTPITHQDSDVQYTYIDNNGNEQSVTWGNKQLALSENVINFLNDNIFPLKYNNNKGNFAFNEAGGLATTLKLSDWYGANWGATTGYIIFTPSALVSDPNVVNVDNYRYYYIAETALRGFDDRSSSLLTNSSSSYIFTNVLATDKLSESGELSYLMGIAYMAGNSSILHNQDKRSDIAVNPFTTLLTSTYTTMFCYDWDSISNDDGANSLISPLTIAAIDQAKFGYYGNYLQFGGAISADQSDQSLKNSFNNWNLIYLGGASKSGINSMDSSFTIIPTWGDTPDALVTNSFVKKMAIATFTNPTDVLGRQITYLRHKISFVIHPQNGFVYFTSGTSLEWQNGLSLWQVRNFSNEITLSHNFGDYDQFRKFVGNIYLSEAEGSKDAKMWFDSNEAVGAIKEINQPFGHGGPTLAFVSAKGIYLVGGSNTPNYMGSVNELFAFCGTNWTNAYKSRSPFFIKGAIKFIPAKSYQVDDKNQLLPNVMTVGGNLMWILTDSPSCYSVQQNTDYFLKNAVDVYIYKDLVDTPAVKPLLQVKANGNITNAIDIVKNPQPKLPPKCNITALQNTMNSQNNGLEKLLNDYLQLPIRGAQGPALPWGCSIDTEYDINNGSIVTQGNQDNSIVHIGIPVTYNGDNSQIVYYAPIINKNNFLAPFYLLDGLLPDNFVTPIVVLNPTYDINQTLIKQELTANNLVKEYGGNSGQNYDEKLAADFNKIFVDDKLTNDYINKYKGTPSNPGYFNNIEYWLIPFPTVSGNTFYLKVWYRFSKEEQWIQNIAMICTNDNYNRGNPINTTTQLTFTGYVPTISMGEGTNIGLVVGIVVTAIVAVGALLGFSIGLPMRKQHKINVLNAKITNRRIDKLSSAVGVSFKKVIESTATINKKVEQLSSSVHRSLVAGNHQTRRIPPTPNSGHTMTQPTNIQRPKSSQPPKSIAPIKKPTRKF